MRRQIAVVVPLLPTQSLVNNGEIKEPTETPHAHCRIPERFFAGKLRAIPDISRDFRV